MMKAIYIQTAFVGDLLLSLPTLKQLKREYPGIEIDLICRKGLGSFMQKTTYVDNFFEYDKGDKSTIEELIQELQEVKYDLLLCPHESFTSARIAKKIQADKKIGFYHWWNNSFFDIRIKRDKSLPEPLRQLSLFGEVKKRVKNSIDQYINSLESSDSKLKPIFEEISMEVPYFRGLRKSNKQEVLPGDLIDASLGKYVCLAPGSVWNTKRWNEDGYLNLAKRLLEDGYGLVLIGSPDEAKLCENIVTSLESPKVVSLAGKTNLWSAAETISLSEFLICNDSGAMHMASLSATPCVSIFGPTVLDFGYRPWNNFSYVEQVPLKCRPCGLHGHKKCPLDNHKCMKDIKSEQVYKTVSQKIKKRLGESRH